MNDSATNSIDDKKMRVGLFVTWLVDLRRPRIGFAALRLLEAAGCEVAVPTTQACCGQPNYNSGERAGAQRLALKTIEAFAPCDYVEAPSGSRVGMVRTHYPELCSDRPDELQRVRQLLRAHRFMPAPQGHTFRELYARRQR